MPDSGRFIEELKKAWRDEKSSALTYAAAADRESDARRRDIFQRMAAEEEKHAARWEKRLRELGSDPGVYAETRAETARRKALVEKGAEAVVKVMEAAEDNANGGYETLAALSPSEEDRIAFEETGLTERSHDVALREMFPDRVSPLRALEGILGKERHVRGGGWIGQAIYGINDGLGAAFGVVSGVAGATHVNSSFVLLSGFASMVASALSMGSGAYLADKSQKEVYEAEMAKERAEIEEHPEEEQQELSLFYQLKGFTAQEADAMAARMAQNPEEMLKTLAHEELGLSEQAFPNPWRSAASATAATALGAAVPVLPYLFSTGLPALVISFVISTLAHFAVGAAKVVVTGRTWWKSGLEMMLIGLGEAAITYGIGLLVAPMIGG
ncbi:MAG TPA: VIT1/CCC1 transporter family protein [Spirochaetia bacterium]|nr:VIT1/CCC1 transporter family protein [Spirochaetia bacterium]